MPIHTHMIISEQQVQLVLDYLHTQNVPTRKRAFADAGVSDEFVERIKREIALAPDTRDDRVAMGRELIASQAVSSDDVAAKMIGRIISDSLR